MSVPDITTGQRAMTLSDALARAEKLVPVLADRASDAEKARRVPDETIADLKEAGLLRLVTPARFGGPGCDFSASWEVGYRLAQGCGSTAWVYMVSQVHAYQVGLSPLAAQEEYFADPDVISSSAFAPTGKVELVDGGWNIQGAWPFSSGADHAAWYLLGAIVPGRGHVLSMVPASDVAIVDDWHVSGLRATGSKTLRIDHPVFVPEHRWVPVVGDGNAEMRDVHDRPSYGSPLQGLAAFTLLAPIVGMTAAAVDLFTAQASQRRVRGTPVAEMQATHLRIAESAAELETARRLCRDLLAEHARRGGAGEQWTVEERVRYRLLHCFVSRLCVTAVNRIFDGAGGNAIYDRNPLQRFHRDVNAASHQIGLSWDDNAPMYGRVCFGAEPGGPMW